jgi:hypothetical protein
MWWAWSRREKGDSEEMILSTSALYVQGRGRLRVPREWIARNARLRFQA